MDRLNETAGSFKPGELRKFTEGVSWPIGKDDLAAIMKQNGAPDGLVAKVQEADIDQFQDQNELMSKTGI
ncbi:MAG: hypothetical protein AVDCRST_MAG87-1814 [uncultured Thermomicrobiales bacterium]|uniref:DUF2795 domain-containing protein n=1 Tax=uncultured Thermomicrobiales bacterium TaxID=1645740 RepID=A0A6J4V1A6_9BACT|nr:MAG: hypothetical protein AVDCRST_MAG87-1814 [uncultured Thermomicrobiales bacterium]